MRDDTNFRVLVDPEQLIFSSCEGHRLVEHTCNSGYDELHMNEVLFTQGDIRILTEKQKEYFWEPWNCHLCCEWFHFNHGHSSEWREFFYEHRCGIFGKDFIDEWKADAPLITRRR